MDYIWDWKPVAADMMTKKTISHHSNYHAFKILREGENVVLRAKQFLFSQNWVPEAGLKLLKDQQDVEVPMAAVAAFRIENLNLKQVFLDLNKFYFTMDLEKRMRVQSSYDRLRKKLESLPAKKDSFLKLRIGDLKAQEVETLEPRVPEHFAHLTDEVENIPELEGRGHSPI